MKMARNKKMITMTIDPELVDRLDEWIRKQEFPPHRNAIVEAAIVAFLDKKEADK